MLNPLIFVWHGDNLKNWQKRDNLWQILQILFFSTHLLSSDPARDFRLPTVGVSRRE